MKLTPTKVLHYGLLLLAAYIVYSWLVKEGGGRDSYEHHPRNKGKFKDTKVKGHKYADHVRRVDEEDATDQTLRDVVKHKQGHVKKKPVKTDVEDINEQPEEMNREYEEEGSENENVFKDMNDVKEKQDSKEGQDNVLKVKTYDDDGEDLLKEFNEADIGKEDPEVQKQIDKLSDHKNVKIPKLEKEWHEEHDDIDTAQDKVKRRKDFFEKMRSLKEGGEDEMQEDIHIHERQDDFVFVTAASSGTFKGALLFIYSVQMNYPENDIGIFDLGLSDEEIDFLDGLCQVEVVMSFIEMYPDFIKSDMSQKLWRPIILQLALARFGHYVYVDPMRFLKRGSDLREHFALSRKGGAAMFGNVKRYSTVVVTNPEMYYFLAINVRKMLRLEHVEITMMIMHNSKHLRHFFSRWLTGCATEEYCIAPPGSKRKCNQNLYPKSKRYADCHRYDDSAINLLLASWHNYDHDHYAAADDITKYYDGSDPKPYLNKCKKEKKKEL